MLVEVKKQAPVTVHVHIPLFVKHRSYDWYIMITEAEAIEVTPYQLRIEAKDLAFTFYENKLLAAIGEDYFTISSEAFRKAYQAFVDLTSGAVAKATSK